MPLVKTPMIAPTKMYESVPTLSPDEAADIIVEAIVERPVRIATRLGTFAQVFYALAPRVYEIVMKTSWSPRSLSWNSTASRCTFAISSNSPASAVSSK